MACNSTAAPAAAAVLFSTFLLFFFFSFAGVVSAGDECPPFSCGNLTNIKNPFRLKGDPDNCGDPNYELTCDGLNRTILTLLFHSYYVTNISYSGFADYYVDFKIHVMDVTRVNVDGGSCQLPPSSLTPSKLRNNHYYEIFSWVTLVNCSQKMNNNNSTLHTDYRPVPCLSHNNSFIYFIPPSYAIRVGYLMCSCRFLAMFPADYREYYMSDRQPADIFKILARGFTLYRPYSAAQTIRYCLRWSLRETYKDITNNVNSVKHRIQSVIFGIELKFLGCIDIKDHNQNPHFLTVYIVVIFWQIAKAFIVLTVLARCVFVPLIVYAFLASKLYQMMSSIDIVEKFLRNQQTLLPTRYSYTDIIAMTGHFKDKLGQGGFGSVFKGRLPLDRLIAIKMLGNSKHNTGEDFINEVSTIGRIHHINVVKLIGFCSDGPQRALVYEYMPNGSLDKFIFSSKNNGPNHKFSLDKLIDIALGVARGIDYLHKGCDMQILHFDIKPHNILLDHNFNPKVSDFGLAKLYPRDHSMLSLSVARGTVGYIAPELISRSFGVISHKSDVYSFGMLLLEMAGGRRNSDPRAENTSQVYYPSWIYDKLIDNNNAVEQDVLQEMDASIVIDEREKKLCMIGLWCIQIRPSDRPSMSKVIEMLEGDVSCLQMPPKPFFSDNSQMTSKVSCLNADDGELTTISEDVDEIE